MPRYLILTLEGPIMAFGDEIVDNLGRVRSFPGASNLVGLIGNALGWQRTMRAEHQALQERLDYAVRVDRPGEVISDFQTAKLEKNDRGWTTGGVPEGRAGGDAAYRSPHLRYRDMVADARLTVALCLTPESQPPTLAEVAAALARPARPLFLGRKPCLPARPLCQPDPQYIEADNALTAAAAADAADGGGPIARLIGPASVRLAGFDQRFIADERNWLSGVHGGGRMFAFGTVGELSGSAKDTP
jgi:CRISPR system Cascade subunit CasD